MAIDLGLLLFAFTAGAASFFSPCCIAMLPAYVGYAVRPSSRIAKEDTVPPAVEPGTPRPLSIAFAMGIVGFVTFLTGLSAFLVKGLSSFDLVPVEWETALPPLDVSIGILVIGAITTAGSFVLAGRGADAARGAVFGSLTTAGLFAVFLPVGLPVAFLAKWLTPYLSWTAVLVGGLLVVLGISMLVGFSIAPRIPTLRADLSSPKGFFLFGMGYGIAGLSCTFPVFLAVVAAGAVSGGFESAIGVFLAYVLGKGSLLIAITVLTVAGGTSVGNRVKRLTPYVKIASGVLLIAGGGYVAYYYGKLLVGGV